MRVHRFNLYYRRSGCCKFIWLCKCATCVRVVVNGEIIWSHLRMRSCIFCNLNMHSVSLHSSAANAHVVVRISTNHRFRKLFEAIGYKLV